MRICVCRQEMVVMVVLVLHRVARKNLRAWYLSKNLKVRMQAS